MAQTDLINEGLLGEYHDELMKTHIAGGCVFDISAYHASNGTPATYASLSAALGTNGANVPVNLRKGGMSVKFVLTSDNNSTQYVQYRYISDDVTTAATFTNVANWQGVDEVPTVGSRNLVQSGGVQAKTQVYDSCIYQVRTANLFDKTKIIRGGYVNRDTGKIRSTAGTTNYFTTDFIPIDSAGCYAYQAYYGGTYAGYACYSAASESSYTHGGSSKQAVFQEGDAYVRFSCTDINNLDTFMVIRGTAADQPSEYEPYGYFGSLKENTVNTDAIKNKAITPAKLSDDALDAVKVPINKDILIEDNTYFLYVAGGLHAVNQYVKQLSIPSLDVTKQYTFQFTKQTGNFTDLTIKERETSTQILREHVGKNGINKLGSLGFVYVEDIDGLFAYNCNGIIDTFKVVNCANNMNAQLSCLELKVNEDAGRENVDVMWNLPDTLTVDSTYRFWYNENTLIRDYDILFKNGHYFDITTDCSSNNRGEGYGNVLCDGTYIKFSVYRKNYDNTSTEIASHTITLDVGTKLTNATKNVIFVGDSYTNTKWGKKGLIGYVQEFAEADGNTVISKGIRTVYDETKAEGYNGYAISDFLAYTPTDQRPADWPNTPSPIKCSPFMFSDDDTAANAKFNFAKYLTDYNIGQVDCIVIFLGINGGSYSTLRNMIQGSDSTYVSSFRAALPNVKIIVVNLPAYYGFKTLSDVSKNDGNNDRIGRNNNYIKYLAGQIENVVIAPTNEMDRIYGYRISDTLQAWTQFQNDTEVDNDVEIPKNYGPRDIHPSTSGIKSIAYSVYHCLFVDD